MIFNTLIISLLYTFISKMAVVWKHIFISHNEDAKKVTHSHALAGYSLLNYTRMTLGGGKQNIIISHQLQGI